MYCRSRDRWIQAKTRPIWSHRGVIQHVISSHVVFSNIEKDDNKMFDYSLSKRNACFVAFRNPCSLLSLFSVHSGALFSSQWNVRNTNLQIPASDSLNHQFHRKSANITGRVSENRHPTQELRAQSRPRRLDIVERFNMWICCFALWRECL